MTQSTCQYVSAMLVNGTYGFIKRMSVCMCDVSKYHRIMINFACLKGFSSQVVTKLAIHQLPEQVISRDSDSKADIS